MIVDITEGSYLSQGFPLAQIPQLQKWSSLSQVKTSLTLFSLLISTDCSMHNNGCMYAVNYSTGHYKSLKFHQYQHQLYLSSTRGKPENGQQSILVAHEWRSISFNQPCYHSRLIESSSGGYLGYHCAMRLASNGNYIGTCQVRADGPCLSPPTNSSSLMTFEMGIPRSTINLHITTHDNIPSY